MHRLINNRYLQSRSRVFIMATIIVSLLALAPMGAVMAQVSNGDDDTGTLTQATSTQATTTQATSTQATSTPATTTQATSTQATTTPDTGTSTTSPATATTTATSTATTTATSTGGTGTIGTESQTTSNIISSLRTEIMHLMDRLQILQNRLQMLLSGQNAGTGTTTATSSSNTSGGAMLNPNNLTVLVGSSVDFNGRNFGREEDIVVTLNGQTVANAHADGGGNFSTGSIRAPQMAGTYTYIFSGEQGSSASVTVMVTR